LVLPQEEDPVSPEEIPMEEDLSESDIKIQTKKKKKKKKSSPSKVAATIKNNFDAMNLALVQKKDNTKEIDSTLDADSDSNFNSKDSLKRRKSKRLETKNSSLKTNV